MRISFLLTGFGVSGGPFMLLKFMDALSQRGHEVYGITSKSRIKWEPGLSAGLWGKQPMHSHRFRFKDFLGGLSSIILGKEKTRKITASLKNKKSPQVLWKRTKRTIGLLNNWIESDVTIATHWTTAYAAYFLMDKTVPLYYIQMYEELFCRDELEQKQARLTYFLPLVLMTGSHWLRGQIRHRTGKDAYVLFPGMPAIDCTEEGVKLDLERKYLLAKKIKVLSYVRGGGPLYGYSELIETMRIVFDKLGRDNVEWNVFGLSPDITLPEDIPVNYVNGRGKELIPLFLESHISLSAYWYTGFSGGLEAMSAGTAVVTPPVGTEGVAVDGENSLIVPVRDTSALADAVIRLAQDRQLAIKLARNGLKTVRQFTWDIAAGNLEKILKEAADNYPYKGKFADIPTLLQGDKETIIKTLSW